MKKKITTKKKIILLAVIVLLAAAIAITAVISLNVYSQEQMKKIPPMTAMETLSYTLKDTENAVVTIGTIQNGEKSWKVYGNNCSELPAELHTYEICSLTKTVTAAMTAQAVRDGLLDIDETIDNYLDLPADNTYPTVRDLLTHTSGYKEYYFESPMIGNFFTGRNSFCGITDEMLLDTLGKLSTENEDKSWRYSNFGFAVLGQLLEKFYDGEYTALANAFLQKLGMTNSHISTCEGDLGNYWDWKAEDAYLSAGAIVSDIDDMLVYAQHQLDGEGIFALAHTPLREVNATPDSYAMLDMRVDAMGMAWIIDEEHGFIWHNGASGNYNCYLGLCPDTQTAVVVLSNLSPGYRIPATITGIKLLEEMQWAPLVSGIVNRNAPHREIKIWN